MRVGIDIDNTKSVMMKAFPSLAKKTGFDVPSSASKQETGKAWFHKHGLHKEFTILQGQIYGEFIFLAHIFEGVLHFIADAIETEASALPCKHEKQNIP